MKRVTHATWRRRIESVKNTSVNIAGKLPQGLVELYADIRGHTQALGIDFLVVGATARDSVFVHGFGCPVERGTTDVDFGIHVASWDEFSALKDRLLAAGYKADAHKIHRFSHGVPKGPRWEIDIVPFGKIAGNDNKIGWPPEQDIVMNVLGFSEAFEHALDVHISADPDIVIPVASPAGMCLLKLVSWLDREIGLRARDAADFEYLIRSYTKIPEIRDALFEEGQMEAQDWDQTKASAMKLGQDAREISSAATQVFLKESLFDQPSKKEEFARDMQRQNRRDLTQCAELLEIFSAAFLKGST
ncbi:MAG: hypothetical protein F4X01_02650 [Nitrospira sp. SB0661_bin_20]|nr:hypothetical protein [Nitrospira sp. SB0661_bin_20]